MKLKTLKEIAKKANKEDELSFGGYTEDYLKQEAIRDIKTLRKAIDEYGIENDKVDLSEILPFCCDDVAHLDDWQGHLCSVIVYIEWKFNITEEDLK